MLNISGPNSNDSCAHRQMQVGLVDISRYLGELESERQSLQRSIYSRTRPRRQQQQTMETSGSSRNSRHQWERQRTQQTSHALSGQANLYENSIGQRSSGGRAPSANSSNRQTTHQHSNYSWRRQNFQSSNSASSRLVQPSMTQPNTHSYFQTYSAPQQQQQQQRPHQMNGSQQHGSYGPQSASYQLGATVLLSPTNSHLSSVPIVYSNIAVQCPMCGGLFYTHRNQFPRNCPNCRENV